jgi:hypothetical protein
MTCSRGASIIGVPLKSAAWQMAVSFSALRLLPRASGT